MEVRSQILRKAFGCVEVHCFNTGEKISHTRTVVRECCKGDDASQWENGKFDPLPRPNPLTDHHQNLRTWFCLGYLQTYKI